jgi:hypothetical protein
MASAADGSSDGTVLNFLVTELLLQEIVLNLCASYVPVGRF